MPTFKAQIRIKKPDEDEEKENKQFNIKIRISHRHKTRYIRTPYYCLPEQFDNSEGKVIARRHKNASFMNIELANIINKYERRIIDFGSRVQYMDINNLFSYLKGSGYETSFKQFGDEVVKKLKASARMQYALSIQQTINKVDAFNSNISFSFDMIDRFWLDDFENYCRKQGNITNTIAVNMRNIRKLYNDAIDKNCARIELYPFRKYKIRNEDTKHRTINDELLTFLLTYYPQKNNEKTAIDIFRLSFYLIGMNYKDMFFAQKSNLKHGRLYYIRNKTKRSYNIKVEDEAREIINKHKGRKYLLNILERKKITKKDRSTIPYRDLISYHNKLLKRIVKRNKFSDNISSYYARHTWATIAHRIGIEKDIIRMALGHGQRTVTDIYIDYDISKIDEANRKVIDYVNSLQK